MPHIEQEAPSMINRLRSVDIRKTFYKIVGAVGVVATMAACADKGLAQQQPETGPRPPMPLSSHSPYALESRKQGELTCPDPNGVDKAILILPHGDGPTAEPFYKSPHEALEVPLDDYPKIVDKFKLDTEYKAENMQANGGTVTEARFYIGDSREVSEAVVYVQKYDNGEWQWRNGKLCNTWAIAGSEGNE